MHPKPWTFFLGGSDLEMLTIGELLTEFRVPFCDRHLSWGAAASEYLEEVTQVVQAGLLGLSSNRWHRHLELVAANDRGHIRALRRLQPPATGEEIRDIRAADLKAQGVTETEIAEARAAAALAQQYCAGRLTVAHSAGRTGLVAEMLEPFFDGPGFQNVLITSPQ